MHDSSVEEFQCLRIRGKFGSEARKEKNSKRIEFDIKGNFSKISGRKDHSLLNKVCRGNKGSILFDVKQCFPILRIYSNEKGCEHSYFTCRILRYRYLLKVL